MSFVLNKTNQDHQNMTHTESVQGSRKSSGSIASRYNPEAEPFVPGQMPLNVPFQSGTEEIPANMAYQLPNDFEQPYETHLGRDQHPSCEMYSGEQCLPHQPYDAYPGGSWDHPPVNNQHMHGDWHVQPGPSSDPGYASFPIGSPIMYAPHTAPSYVTWPETGSPYPGHPDYNDGSMQPVPIHSRQSSAPYMNYGDDASHYTPSPSRLSTHTAYSNVDPMAAPLNMAHGAYPPYRQDYPPQGYQAYAGPGGFQEFKQTGVDATPQKRATLRKGYKKNKRNKASHNQTSKPKEGQVFTYPDPNLLERNKIDLMGIANAIPISRRRNALSGKELDVLEERVEEQTQQRTINGRVPTNVMFRDIPKKALVLFCGRSTVQRYLRTTEREDNDNWVGAPTKQQLRVPPGSCNHVGLKILVSWIRKACKDEFEGQLQPIKAPENLFNALSLLRTLRTFGLHADAERIAQTIKGQWHREIYPDTIEQIWRNIPKGSAYTWRMIEEVKQRLQWHGEANTSYTMPKFDETIALLNKYPTLKARVEVPGENDKHQPLSPAEVGLAKKDARDAAKAAQDAAKKATEAATTNQTPATADGQLCDVTQGMATLNVEDSDGPATSNGWSSPEVSG